MSRFIVFLIVLAVSPVFGAESDALTKFRRQLQETQLRLDKAGGTQLLANERLSKEERKSLMDLLTRQAQLQSKISRLNSKKIHQELEGL